MPHPTGLVHIGRTVLDNSPAVALKDALRKIATAPELVDDPNATAAALVESVQDEVFADAQRRQTYPDPSATECHVHRLTADRMRLVMIRRLEETHVPPYERIPHSTDVFEDDGGDVARSKLFDEIDIHYVHPINATAAIVGGDEPPKD